MAAAKLGGLLTTRLGQAAVLGELLVGVVLGPSFLDLFHLQPFHSPAVEETVFLLAELGVLLLMFVAGLEVEPGDLLRSGRVAAAVGLLGVLTPVLTAAATALYFGFELQRALFLGLVLAATSVSISAQVLIELGRLRTREGLGLLAAAVVDDVLVIFLLSLFIAFAAGGGLSLGPTLLVLARMLLYAGLAVAAGVLLIPGLTRWAERAPVGEGLLAATLAVTLLYAWAAEFLGAMAPITGSFLAGMFFARTPLKHVIEERVRALSYALLVPLFFVSIGMQTDLRSLAGGNPLFLILLTLGAFGSKYVGGLLGALWGGLERSQASRVGIGMISRGEVGLIVASVGLGQGLLGAQGFAAVVMVVVATTLLTPILLKLSYAGEEAPHG